MSYIFNNYYLNLFQFISLFISLSRSSSNLNWLQFNKIDIFSIFRIKNCLKTTPLNALTRIRLAFERRGDSTGRNSRKEVSRVFQKAGNDWWEGKKKKKKENSTRSINEEKKVTSVLRSTWDPRPRDVIALIRIIKNAANYDAARTFSFRHARFHIARYQREISHWPVSSLWILLFLFASLLINVSYYRS